MGLLKSYSKSNRVIITDKTVTYSKNRIYGQWSWVDILVVRTIGWAWEYHRYCHKSYKYVGMDRGTAQKCAEAMITKYTRSTKISNFNTSTGTFTDSDGGSNCMADITIQKRDGCMYDVVVTVREDDTRIRTTSHTPSLLFTAENNRDYDEGE